MFINYYQKVKFFSGPGCGEIDKLTVKEPGSGIGRSVLIRMVFSNTELLSNLRRATSRGYINFGCPREVLFLGGNFQWSMCRAGEIFMPAEVAAR